VSASRRSFYLRAGKRVLDLVLATGLLVLASPVLAMTAVLVWARLGRPILYAERRAGQHGTPFLLRKFRTMTDALDGEGRLLPDAARLTPFGAVLRRTSLDELPELWSVIRGEMSLVGPRPLPVRYLDRYSHRERRRLEAVPGLTGLVQVRGRNGLSWSEKFALDVWYVDHRSLALDLKLLLQTAVVVLKADGISQPGQATMEEFMGSAR
jgi:sugar transferase EpsL